MIHPFGLALLMMLFQSPASAQAAPAAQAPSTVQQPELSKAAEATPPVDKGNSLLKIRRIYVESFGTTEASQQLQAMIISSLTASKRLTVTEDKSKADAILKGVGAERSSQEVHAYGSSTSVATAGGSHSGSISGAGGVVSGHHSGVFGAAASAIDDSSVNTETIDNAKASVRLINPDGDVIWTSTQESRGAKYKGASSDVADKIVKQLLRDIELAGKESPASAAKS